MKITHKIVCERIVTDKVICDMCGREIVDRWADYEVNEVEIKHSKGMSYPCESWGNTLELDICPDCWCNDVLPFLREKGVTREYVEYRY